MTVPTPASISLDDAGAVAGLWLEADHSRACLVLAHGAGARMGHRAMMSLAHGLAEREISTLRFDFPFMARGSRRPDTPAVAQVAVRAAVADARRRTDLPLFAGGRSFGGRMTSRAQAEAHCRACAASCSSPSRSIRPGSLRPVVPIISRACRCRYSSSKAPGTRWRRSTCCARSSTRSGRMPG